MSFQETVRQAEDGFIPLLFEDFQPPQVKGDRRYPDAFLPKRIARLEALLDTVPIDAVNIPEVYVEDHNGERELDGGEKVDPRIYGEDIATALSLDRENCIVNHVTVREDSEESLVSYHTETVEEYGIPNVVHVGGEHGTIDYSGPGPVRANELLRKHVSPAEGVAVGNISIPWRRPLPVLEHIFANGTGNEVGLERARQRREEDRSLQWDEPERIYEKAAAGADFFTSQIVFESETTKALLDDLDALYEDADDSPPLYIVSFAAPDCAQCKDFFHHLDVEIPSLAEAQLVEGGWPADRYAEAAARQKVADRAIDYLASVARDIAAYREAEDIAVPIGFQAEYGRFHTFNPEEGKGPGYTAIRLADRLDTVRGEFL